MDTGETARVFGDRYVLGERLTAGADREVWRAHDDVVSRAVALKIYFGPAVADAGWQRSFARRADRLVALSHPGIAKVYEHGASRDEAWLAMAFVAGTPLAGRPGDRGRDLDHHAALDVLGQAALALSAAHGAGVVHGDLRDERLMIREDGSVTLIGFAVDADATRDDDLSALRGLADQLLTAPAAAPAGSPQPAAVTGFLDWLHHPDRDPKAGDAAEVGRTALALAATMTPRAADGAATVASRPAAVPAPRPEPAPGSSPPEETSEAAAQRKMVRNRLIILATIVVVGGAALLRFVGEGGGDVTVPSVTNLPVDQAKLTLTRDGLRGDAQCRIGKDSGGTVVSQTPPAGRSVKAGSVVTMTYGRDAC